MLELNMFLWLIIYQKHFLSLFHDQFLIKHVSMTNNLSNAFLNTFLWQITKHISKHISLTDNKFSVFLWLILNETTF